jgi:hypothetical protein
MSDVCPCHGEPWYIRKNSPARVAAGYGPIQRLCIVKKRATDLASRNTPAGRARCRAADERYSARKRAFRIEQKRLRRERRREALDRKDAKLGKLLNLSVHGATEAERRLARSKYNDLKARKVA